MELEMMLAVVAVALPGSSEQWKARFDIRCCYHGFIIHVWHYPPVSPPNDATPMKSTPAAGCVALNPPVLEWPA